MVATAAKVEWIQVENDVEALMLEYNLIKKHRPKFNVRLVDDKSYPYLALTMSEEWPRPIVTRGKKRKGTKYFGPYAHAYAIRNTLDELLKTFPLRSCSNAKLERHQKLGKPCLLFHIDKCSGPCIDAVTSAEYDKMVESLARFLNGDRGDVVKALEDKMAFAAKEHDFELAARIRDQIRSITKSSERQSMVGQADEEIDVIGITSDEIEAAIYVFYVRSGRVVGQRSFIFDLTEDISDAFIGDKVLELLYGDVDAQPPAKTILLPHTPTDLDLYSEWLSLLRESKVEIKVPQRGSKVELLGTVTKNATEELTKHRLKRASDHNSRSRALNELQKHLGLKEAPLRIECFDMSHLQGTNYVGSMVVFEDGLAKNSDYRRFKVESVEGNDDYGAMYEVVTRRLQNYLNERELPSDNQKKFAYPPKLLVVDGGKGQLSMAVKALEEQGLTDEIAVCAIAKRFEEIFLPGKSESVMIPRQSEALYLMQRLRDESHRFAITYHRQLRDKAMKASALDGIKGLGPKRQERLKKEIGSVNKIKKTDLEQLKAITWLPDEVAEAIYAKFH